MIVQEVGGGAIDSTTPTPSNTGNTSTPTTGEYDTSIVMEYAHDMTSNERRVIAQNNYLVIPKTSPVFHMYDGTKARRESEFDVGVVEAKLTFDGDNTPYLLGVDTSTKKDIGNAIQFKILDISSIPNQKLMGVKTFATLKTVFYRGPGNGSRYVEVPTRTAIIQAHIPVSI